MRNSIISAGFFIVGYGLFLAYGPKPAHAKMQSQGQSNRYMIEKYFRDVQADATRHEVVLVGSSLAKRLEFDDDSKCVFNLAFDGDAALTGLNVVAHAPVKPRLLLIETNIPERVSNSDLIEKASGFLPRISAIFHIENVPVNLAFSYVSSMKKEKTSLVVNESVRLNALATVSLGFKETIPSDLLDKNMAEIKRLVREIEAGGTQVVFYEMPVYTELEGSPRLMQIRNIFSNAFPNNQFVNYRQLAKGSVMRTVDGAHLT